MTHPGRFFLFGLIGLSIGAFAASGVQIGFNVLRFLIQPLWLDGPVLYAAHLVTGLLAAGFMGILCGLVLARTIKGTHTFIALSLAIGAGLLCDPYFLAELGWRGPSLFEPAMRGLSVVIPAIGFGLLWHKNGHRMIPYGLFTLLAVVAHMTLTRFQFIPVLGGDIDLAAMTPIHVLVYARGILFFIIASACAMITDRISLQKSPAHL